MVQIAEKLFEKRFATNAAAQVAVLQCFIQCEQGSKGCAVISGLHQSLMWVWPLPS